MQGYKRFDNLTPIDEQPQHGDNDNNKKSVPKSPSLPLDPSTCPVVLVEGRTAINFGQPHPQELDERRKSYVKTWKFLRASAAIGLLLACSLIILESFIDYLIAHDEDADNFGVCGLGTGVWTGALGVAAGVLGVCSFRTMNGKKPIIIAHFVLVIVASVGDGVMIIITAFCVDALPYVRSSQEWDHDGFYHRLVTHSPHLIPVDQLLYAIGGLLLLVAFVHMLLSLVASSLMCRHYWCSDDDTPATVIYWQRQGGNSENTTCPAPAPMTLTKAVLSPISEPVEVGITSSATYDNNITDTADISRNAY